MTDDTVKGLLDLADELYTDADRFDGEIAAGFRAQADDIVAQFGSKLLPKPSKESPLPLPENSEKDEDDELMRQILIAIRKTDPKLIEKAPKRGFLKMLMGN